MGGEETMEMACATDNEPGERQPKKKNWLTPRGRRGECSQEQENDVCQNIDNQDNSDNVRNIHKRQETLDANMIKILLCLNF